MNKIGFRQIIVALSVLVTITINALAEALPINGGGTGQISDTFKIFFVPAGYVFSIWGVIYLGLIVFAVFQFLPSQRANPRMRAITGYFLVSCAANCAWIFLWHYEIFTWTLLAMAVLLVSLILIYLKLSTGKTTVDKAETWMVRIPFSIYLGWVTVAAIANAADVLYYVGWSAWGIAPQVWTVIMLAIAIVLAAVMAVTRRDAAYLFVLVWAFVGIGARFPAISAVALPAWVAAGLALIMALWSLAAPKNQIIKMNS